MRPEELFRLTEKGALPSTILLEGDDAFLSREWKKLLRRVGFEVMTHELARTGPDADVEAQVSGLSLFNSKRFVWLHAPSALSQWNAAALKLWTRLSAQADSQNLVLAVQVPESRKGKAPASRAPSFEERIEFSISSATLSSWLKRMTQSRSSESLGPALGAPQLNFLMSLEADPLTLDNWVELWMLGGDEWARVALGWGLSGSRSASVEGGSSPAFAWVDAVLQGRKQDSLNLLESLLAEGAEPLQLVALLSKSVRIYAQLECGRVPTDQADFLIRKIQREQSTGRSGRGRTLLVRLADIDRLLKSSPVKARALLAQL